MSNCDIIIKTEDVLQTLLLTEDSLQLIIASEMGPKGDPGVAGGSTIPATVATGGVGVSGQRAVYAAILGLTHAEPSSFITSQVIGITKGSALSGAVVTIQPSGEMQEITWNWTPGLPVYLGTAGTLTQVVPTVGYQAELAVALSTDRIVINIQPSIALN